MRFKARLTNDKLGIFQGVITTLDKIGKRSVVHLSEETIKFTVIESKVDDVRAFAELNVQGLFMEWRIESQSDNCILIEVGFQNLLDALNSARRAPQCQIKLTKRSGQPCLCLETRALEVEVVHDIPVTLMRASEHEYYLPPEVPQPQVQIELPSSKSFKNVIDRMKGLTKNIYIQGDMAGSLTVRLESDMVHIRSFFSNLQPRFESLDDNSETNKAIVKVDAKTLATVLHSYGLRHDSMIMCLIEGCSLVLHVVLSPTCTGTLTFYLQIISLNEDDWEE
mmetsp:Transcript_24923/g.34158  ORF Transcript_24923/g.34158 Transcript_24923/m.34158 type:complete len:280 (-) Transcript_24923:433-1272(-)|eukprot:CAMPEP_0185791840 /NCGR_PEP_ID=MMETSP1174-20130828/158601_1 /TAXON_ID=35687 /ORGANISM="Dictyocha speculum, Strain CCMP1381" /LENGTH=279 /DNA_ID=CAMNT_0028486841 /DNA_START=61 /DNA_END=900 /DNA_ORIENTATION=-